MPANRDTFIYEDFVFEKLYGFLPEDISLSIVKYTGSNPFVVIPSSCMGMPVDSITNIGSNVIETVVIPDTIHTVCKSAFENSENLKEVMLKKNDMIVFGNMAFKNCKKLERITIDKVSDLYISLWCFQNCDSLKNLDFLSVQKLSIQRDAFKNSGLVNIVLSDDTICYGESFSHTPLLENISVSSSNKTLNDSRGVLYSKDYSKLIKYPNGRTIATYFLHKDCKQTMPSSITNKHLKTLHAENVENIEYSTFSNLYDCKERAGINHLYITDKIKGLDNSICDLRSFRTKIHVSGNQSFIKGWAKLNKFPERNILSLSKLKQFLEVSPETELEKI